MTFIPYRPCTVYPDSVRCERCPNCVATARSIEWLREVESEDPFTTEQMVVDDGRWKAVQERIQHARYIVLAERAGGTSVSEIHDACRLGKITAEQGAMLLELRQRIAWRRRPWWQRWAIVLWRAIWSW